MNPQSDAMPESFDQQKAAPANLSPTRPFFWSVQRELWEYRSIYIAPLAAAAVALFAFLISLFRLPHKMRTLSALDAASQHETLVMPFHLTAALIMAVAIIVSIFYCLDSLHGERRDRSILFWKSLPVSDLTTVLAKASIPILILQLISFAITVATQWVMLLLSTVVVFGSSQSVATLWTQVSLFRMSLGLLYHLITMHGFWYAPIYAWLILVSAWARRAPLLWAVLPWLSIFAVEKIAFNTSHFASFLAHHFEGGAEAMGPPGMFPIDSGMMITFGRYLTAPGLWIGLAFAAAFLAAAVRLRRYQGPV
jgi:ABC-2 type transport system permease protein